MTWIRVDTNLSHHPKVGRLGGILKTDRTHIVGVLVSLWTWAMEYAPDGDLSRYTNGELESAVGLETLPIFAETPLLDALVESGFVDRNRRRYRLHDWDDYAGVLLQQRDRSRRRMALYRDHELRAAVRQRDGDLCRYCGREVNWKDHRGPSGGTYDHVDPNGSNTEANLVVACRECNGAKSNGSPEAAGLHLRPAAFPATTELQTDQTSSRRTNERTERTNETKTPREGGAKRASGSRTATEGKPIGEILEGVEGPIADRMRRRAAEGE